MRIKSIKGTTDYKKIEFSNIKDEWENDNKDLHILTPNGWTQILNFSYMKSGPAKVIKTDCESFICDPGHILKASNNGELQPTRADLLDSETHKLCSYDEELIDFTISDDLNIHDFYDITIADPHWYYTSDIVSHNSILLCNNAMASLRGPGPSGTNGQDVLLITFELDVFKTAMRCLASTVGIPMDQLHNHQDLISRTMNTMKETYKKRFYIYEWPPDECSVNHIYSLLQTLKRTEGWKPDVIIIDYMDLMMSRQKEYNKDEYSRQKHVATEIRGLAKNENVLVFTATQTNRSGMDGDKPIDLNKSAESFGKQFSLDYVISLNQSMDERSQDPAQLRFFVAKNRNGPKHVTITCEIDYKTMVVRESATQPAMRTEAVNDDKKAFKRRD
jgi:hypothetical protein